MKGSKSGLWGREKGLPEPEEGVSGIQILAEPFGVNAQSGGAM